MEVSPEVTNVKNELKRMKTDWITTYRLETPKMSIGSIKQESDWLLNSEIDIKTEQQQDEIELPVIPSTSYEICPNYDVQIETDEEMVKLEYEGLFDESMQDPLDVGSQYKGTEESKEYLTSGSEYETKLKTQRKKCRLTRKQKSDTNKSIEKNPFVGKNNQFRISKKHICHICHKTLPGKYFLEEHLRSHTGEKPFECNICQKSFPTKRSLVRHTQIHSNETTQVCDACNKVNQYNWRRSTLKPDDKSLEQNEDPVDREQIHTCNNQHICDVCNKAFRIKSSLDRHRPIHEKEKSYSCNVCNKLFTQKMQLNRHTKIHNNIKDDMSQPMSVGLTTCTARHFEKHWPIIISKKNFRKKVTSNKNTF